MTSRTDSAAHPPGEFALARAKAELDNKAVRIRAANTVAQQAINSDDRTCLLSMLGLDDTTAVPAETKAAGGETFGQLAFERGLAGYVHAVATALGVPAEATGYESSDTITAYVGLPDRWADRPQRDLMLVWSERNGWLVAVETQPTESVHVIGYLGGQDILPHPNTVAQFVLKLLSGQWSLQPQPAHPPRTPGELAVLMNRHYGPLPAPAGMIRHFKPRSWA